MINLLPTQYKAELKQEENWKLVLILGFLFLIFLISLILILFSIKAYIQGEVQSFKILTELQEKTFQTEENRLLREKINSVNQNLSKLISFYRTKTNSAEILEKISQPLSSQIYLTNVSWQKDTSRVSLSGYAPSREILLEFKRNLEEREDFTEVYFPPSNWLKPVDIDFQVSFKLGANF